MHLRDWQVIRKFSGFYNIPVVAIVIAAMFLKGASTRAFGPSFFSSAGIYGHYFCLGQMGFTLSTGNGILFLIEISLLLIIRDHKQSNIVSRSTEVDLTPWRGPLAYSACTIYRHPWFYTFYYPRLESRAKSS